MKRTSMIVAAAFGLGFSGLAGLSYALSASAQSAATQTTSTERTDTFAIENMTCALCPITVKTAMEHVTGVKSVQVDFNAKTATVVYDPSVAAAEAIAAASTNAGYPAKPVGQGS